MCERARRVGCGDFPPSGRIQAGTSEGSDGAGGGDDLDYVRVGVEDASGGDDDGRMAGPGVSTFRGSEVEFDDVTRGQHRAS